MWLMSMCKHNIICHYSSFSWWGSYMNTNLDKIVIYVEKYDTTPGFFI